MLVSQWVRLLRQWHRSIAARIEQWRLIVWVIQEAVGCGRLVLALRIMVGDPLVINSLIRQLRDRRFYVRARAAEFLGMSRNSRALEPLVQLLKDEEPIVRGAAASALGKLGDRRAIPPLIEALREGAGEPYMRHVIEALRDLDGPMVLDALIEALGYEQPTVRSGAAEALARLGDRRAIPPLVEMLRGQGPRDSAARALAAFGRAAVEPLIGLLDHPNKDVRFFAAKSLGEIGDPSAAGPLTKLLGDEYIIVRKKAAQALAEIGRASVPHLLEVLERGGREALVSACEALGELGDVRAVEPLKRLLAHEDELVRLRASQALRRSGS